MTLNVGTCDKRDMYRLCVSLLPTLAVISIVLFLYFESVTAVHVFNWYLTSYGLLTLSNYTAQFVFAIKNRQWVESLPVSNESSSVAVHVVGYRENADYFRMCLESVKELTYKSLSRIIIVVDGRDMADVYMGEIAKEVFGNACACINIPELLQVGSRTQYKYFDKYISPYAQKQVLCVLQPHGGKRCALYTAMKISSFMGYQFFFNTDSDTILPPGILQPMVDAMVYDHGIGAVAGDLKIFNTDHSFLAALSNVRYYFAFNVERAAQSSFGSVMCVSGPNGLYRTNCVKEIVDSWFMQQFLGKPCAAGDDRHLSNCILGLGNKIVYTHKSCALTETPATYVRWLKQQIRWMKSFYREMGYSLINVCHKHHWYMNWDLTFTSLYPAALLVTLILSIYVHTSLWGFLAMLVASFIIPLLRASACYLFMDRRPDLFIFAFYSLLYVTSLMPAKMYALCTLGDIKWGTSVRKHASVQNLLSSSSIVLVPVIIWNAILVVGMSLKVKALLSSW